MPFHGQKVVVSDFEKKDCSTEEGGNWELCVNA